MVGAYLWVASQYVQRCGDVDEESLYSYRGWLEASFKPSTADQRVHAMNCYLTFLGREDLKLASVRVRQKTFIDHVIDFRGYRRLINHLRAGEYHRDYHAVRLLATTGVRVSELVSLEVGHTRDGRVGVVSKGRAGRIHMHGAVSRDALEWAEGEGRASGPLLLNRCGNPIAGCVVSLRLKARAVECGVDERLVYPQSFRHLFARCFLETGGDIAFLPDRSRARCDTLMPFAAAWPIASVCSGLMRGSRSESPLPIAMKSPLARTFACRPCYYLRVDKQNARPCVIAFEP